MSPWCVLRESCPLSPSQSPSAPPTRLIVGLDLAAGHPLQVCELEMISPRDPTDIRRHHQASSTSTTRRDEEYLQCVDTDQCERDLGCANESDRESDDVEFFSCCSCCGCGGPWAGRGGKLLLASSCSNSARSSASRDSPPSVKARTCFRARAKLSKLSREGSWW